MLPVSQLSPLTAAHVNPTTEDIISSACTFAMWQQSSGNGNAAILTCDKLQLYFMQRQQSMKQQFGTGTAGHIMAVPAPADGIPHGVDAPLPSNHSLMQPAHRHASPPQSIPDGPTVPQGVSKRLVRQLQVPEPREERREGVVAALVQAFGAGATSPQHRGASATSAVANGNRMPHGASMPFSSAHDDALDATPPDAVARDAREAIVGGSSSVLVDATPPLGGGAIGPQSLSEDPPRGVTSAVDEGSNLLAPSPKEAATRIMLSRNRSLSMRAASMDSVVHPLDVSAIPIFLEDGEDVFGSQPTPTIVPSTAPQPKSPEAANEEASVVKATRDLPRVSPMMVSQVAHRKRMREDTLSSSNSSRSSSANRGSNVGDDCTTSKHPSSSGTSTPSSSRSSSISSSNSQRVAGQHLREAPLEAETVHNGPEDGPSNGSRGANCRSSHSPRGLLRTPLQAPQSEMPRVADEEDVDRAATPDAPTRSDAETARPLPAAAEPLSGSVGMSAQVPLNDVVPLPRRHPPVLNTQRRALRSHKTVGVVSPMFELPTRLPPGRQDAPQGAARRVPSRPTSPPPPHVAQSKASHVVPHQKKKYQPPAAGNK